MKPAAMPVRAAAVVVDGVFVFIVLGAAVGVATGETHRASFSLHGWAAVAWIVLSFGYWIGCERLWGMTIGKRLFSIRVIGEGGAKPTWRQSLVRNLMRLVDGFPYILPYLLGFIVAETSYQRRRIGDHLAATHVVPRD
jgi:uncharacterized RDD family membrane protein YckC